jgi:glycopeptide antibiotics resistance protein
MIYDTLEKAITENYSMLLIFTVVIVSIRIVYLIVNKEKFIFYKELISFAFLLYSLLLFYVVTFQDINYGTNNFVPFKEIFRYELGSKVFIHNIIGNIILFIPFGFFVSTILKTKKVLPILFLSLVTSSVIEYTQLLIGRTFDIDDIILNLCGSLIGYIIYSFLITIIDHVPKIFNTNLFKNIMVIILILVFILIYFKSSLWGILR